MSVSGLEFELLSGRGMKDIAITIIKLRVILMSSEIRRYFFMYSV